MFTPLFRLLQAHSAAVKALEKLLMLYTNVATFLYSLFALTRSLDTFCIAVKEVWRRPLQGTTSFSRFRLPVKKNQ